MHTQTNAAGAAADLLPDHLLSDAEFRRVVEAYLSGPAAAGYAVRLTVISVNNGAEVARYQIEDPPPGDPSQARMLLEDIPSAVTCRCEIWRKPSPAGRRADANALVDSFTTLISKHWGDRDPATMLPFLKSPTGPARFVAAARELAANGRPMAVLHTDLDHFKAVNSDHGEEVGDRTLREFADRFRGAFQVIGVTVRTGGEEFSALLDCDNVGAVLRTTDAFRMQMENVPLAAIGRTNTCSIGLCIYPDGDRFGAAENEDSVLSDARQAERRAKEDGRNRLALIGPAPGKAASRPSDPEDLKTAALGARGFIERDPFGIDASLTSAIHARLVDAFAQTDDVATAITRVRGELGLLVGSFDIADGRPRELLGIIGSLDWGRIVAGALLAATHEHGRPLAPSDRLALVADRAGSLRLEVSGRSISLHCEVAVGAQCKAEIGFPVYRSGTEPPGGIGRLPVPNGPSEHDPLSPVLLLPIGDTAKAVADGIRYLVASVVDVDDRPTRGGGLPDFWQSNLSRVIRACLANPNIGSVIVIGDVTNARLTMERLNAGDSADVNELQRRLSMKASDLAVFVGRRLAISAVPADRAAVLSAIEQAVVRLAPIDFEKRPAIDLLNKSRRRLAIGAPDETHRLAITDGIRTRTLADAYPEALQLIRGAPNSLDQVEPQRGTFREMTGFKVVLTDPLSDRIPDYWQEDRALLDSYYETGFVKSDGLFGSRLHRPFGSSEQSMVDIAACHAADAAVRRTPTRRINLPIVPDALDQPLGLSSIQVMPRVRDGTTLTDAIFVWRTVDALVGFPFSAYGSLRWSEDFLTKVNAELLRRQTGMQVRMGTLTYIALSFHMYLHDGDVEIARTIVQDASN